MDHANHVQERPRCERQGDAQYEKSGLETPPHRQLESERLAEDVQRSESTDRASLVGTGTKPSQFKTGKRG